MKVLLNIKELDAPIYTAAPQSPELLKKVEFMIFEPSDQAVQIAPPFWSKPAELLLKVLLTIVKLFP